MRHICEEQLALYAWGDLPSQESSVITSHLQDCDSCRKALAKFQEMRGFIAASVHNPEADELSEVHTRLIAELQVQQSNARPWAWWGAGVAASLTLLLLPHFFEHRPSATPITESLILTENMDPGPTLQIPLTPITASHPKHLRSQKAGIRSVTLISQTDWEPIVKMITADPNVVILWQLNERTGQEP